MLLDANGAAIEDRWHTVYRLEDLSRAGTVAELFGLRVECGTDITSFAHLLPSLGLVTIHFDKFRDGRGFTLSRALRERFGFVGEIRAEGHLLPDQFPLLIRCGFSTVAIPDTHRSHWAEVIEQASQLPARPMLQRLRRGSAAEV